MEVFKVFTQDKVHFSALLSRSLTFLFLVEVLTIFSLILVRQLFPQFRLKGWASCFSHFSAFEKSAEVPGQVGARVHGHPSSSELSAHQMARLAVQRPFTEAGVAYDVEEYTECHRTHTHTHL